MIHLNTIRKFFGQALLSMDDIPTELKRSLRTNERVNVFLGNIHRQLNDVNRIRARRKQGPLNDKTIREVVKDFTYQFANSVHQYAIDKVASDAEKRRQKEQEDYGKDLDKAAEGKFEGNFEELSEGVTIDESRAVDPVDKKG